MVWEGGSFSRFVAQSLGRGGVVGAHPRPLSSTLLAHVCMDVTTHYLSFLANNSACQLVLSDLAHR